MTESGSRVLGFEFFGSKTRLQLLGYMAQSFTCRNCTVYGSGITVQIVGLKL